MDWSFTTENARINLKFLAHQHDSDGLLDALRNRGFTALSMDVTTSGVIVMGTACGHAPGEAALKAPAEAVTDVREADFHAARVIIPGAYSNAPAAFPFLGGNGLQEAVQNIGTVNPGLLPLPCA